jgi:hypothetical protein
MEVALTPAAPTAPATGEPQAGTQASFNPLSFTRPQPIGYKEALQLLKENGQYVDRMPFKAPSATLWRFKKFNNDWSEQGYGWVEAGGVRTLKDGLQKRSFNIRTPETDPKRGDKGFQMFVWFLQETPSTAIIQFVGNSDLAVDMPHGNTRQKENEAARPYYRTAKSTLNEMRKTDDAPAEFYRKKRADTAKDKPSQVAAMTTTL